jgi:hypothetical protein
MRGPAANRHSSVPSTAPPDRRTVTYLLPIRSTVALDGTELTSYLEWVSSWAQLVVIDGSDSEVFAEHASAWRRLGIHRPPDHALVARNGKVRGVLTGMRFAAHDKVIVADDDVRYDDRAAGQVTDLLDGADVVLPQNHFDPVPWHARWDSARSLVNRALGGDWPGTLGVRRTTFEAAGGYDGDILFENLELVRTIQAHGGRVTRASACFVARRPPTSRHFWSQRTRQAYDEFARPVRMATALAIAPVTVLIACRRPRWLVGLVAAPIVLAAEGRRRDDARRVFPATSMILAPVWMGERAVCAWLALWWRLRGGCPYHGSTLARSAHSRRTLRRRAHLRDQEVRSFGPDATRRWVDGTPRGYCAPDPR